MSTALVVPLRACKTNEELRYALRAAAENLPHDELWIVGTGRGPAWLRPTGWIDAVPTASKWTSIRAAFEAAAAATQLTDFVWMDDDQFVVNHCWTAVAYHLGEADTNPGNTTHTRAMKATREVLRQLGVEQAFNFDVHAPMPINRCSLEWVLSQPAIAADKSLHVRTLYGNLMLGKGELTADFKMRQPSDQFGTPIISTTEQAFKSWPVGDFIRSTFVNPSRWEAAA